MAELTAALEDALSGHGRLVMLVGEPGIGKTRTAQELASLAGTRGAQVLWGRCHEDEGAPPFWPWVQAIRTYVQQAGAEQLTAEMGPGAAAIAEIIPDIRSKLPDLESPASLEPESARFRLFDSITTFLNNAAERQPIMLVLDDLHWADRSSLRLLEFLARELRESRLLLVVCYRDTELSRAHTLVETLAQLSREPVFRRQVLRGLGQDELGHFIEATTRVQLSKDLTGALYDHTEGNPFFMTEVIRLLSDSGELTAGRIGTPEGLRIPEGVREVIGQRLNRMSKQCNEVLTTASIIGREFDFKLLISLNEEGAEDRVLEALEEALAARVIQELSGVIGSYQFSHALIQETLAQELSATRRARFHGRIAQALEALYGVDVETHAAELAHHFAEAELILGPVKLVRYSLLAGEQALAASAYEEALAHFERGLVARDITLSGTEAASDEQAAVLLLGLARAQSSTLEGHRLGEAFANLSRAFEYYADAGNVALALAAAEYQLANPAFRIPGIAELLARAFGLVPADSLEAGRLLSRYGGNLGTAESDYDGAQQALGRAISIARREGDVSLEAQTLTQATVVSGHHLHWQDSVDNGLRAIKLATGDENPYPEFASRYWTAMGFLHLGDLDGARPHAMVLRDLAERRSTPRVLVGRCLSLITYLSCLEGDWRSARESSNRGLEVSPLEPGLLDVRGLLEHETGESARGEVYLERLLKAMLGAGPTQLIAPGRGPMAIAAIARITDVPERLEIAEAAAEASLSYQSVTPLNAMYAKAALALLAVQKGDDSAAEEHYSFLREQRNTMIWTFSSVDRLLGLLSQTMGNLDQSTDHFEDALSFCRKAGYRPELAWTCHNYADTLLQRNDPDDRAKATALLDESLVISSELGMRPLMGRVAGLRELAGSQPAKPPAYPDGLTQREVEVLRLLAAGMTDRQIAGELFISARTVGYHVGNILNKTTSTNRTEAATYASRNGLV